VEDGAAGIPQAEHVAGVEEKKWSATDYFEHFWLTKKR
jgi:hypothetical protein